MPRLREIYVYPYVGWADRPWPGQRPRDSEEPWDDALLDLDAGARSARRVTESVSQALKALGVEAPRGQLMLELPGWATATRSSWSSWSVSWIRRTG